MQRLTFAKTRGPALFDQLAEKYLKSGKVLSLWKEIGSVRSSFIRKYDSIQPLFQLYYWHDSLRNLGAIRLTDKNFEELRQLYIDCFETLCRLTTIVMGIETIIHHNSLEIPTKKGSMTLEQFEGLPNAGKPDHIGKYPIQDLFVPVIDANFRNGIGHHTAHFDPERDEIVLYDSRSGSTVKQTIGYTEFCDKVVKLFAAFELAAMYHQDLHIHLDGRFA